MVNFLTGGGLGDAAMSVAKLWSESNPVNNLDDILLTHVETHAVLIPSIRNFYKSQQIHALVKEIPNWDWLTENRKKYDYWLGTHWSEQDGYEKSWEINPFPPIHYSEFIPNIDILLSPFAGRLGNRNFTVDDINKFQKNHDVTLAGWCNQDFAEQITNKSKRSFINRTTISELVDLIGSSNTVIAPEGFVVYLAGMLGKEVFILDKNIEAITYRVHPKWNVKIIKNLQEVNI